MVYWPISGWWKYRKQAAPPSPLTAAQVALLECLVDEHFRIETPRQRVLELFDFRCVEHLMLRCESSHKAQPIRVSLPSTTSSIWAQGGT